MRLTSHSPPRELFRAVSTSDSVHRLNLLADRHPESPIADFACWDDARRWLDRIGAQHAAADAVLRPVLTAFKWQPDETWHEILLFLFSRSLGRLDRVMRRRDPNPDEVEPEITWAFLQVLHRINLASRATAIGQKIINDTWHDVRLHYQRERTHQERFPSPVMDEEEDEREEDRADPGALDPEFTRADNRHDVARVRARLKDFVRRGILSRADYLILIGCYLYGHGLDAMAARLGMTYEATKKRRQRALEQLKKYLDSAVPGRPRGTP